MADGVQKQASVTWLLFSLSGRASRLAYFLGGLLMAVFQLFVMYRLLQVPPESPESDMWASALSVVLFVSLWVSFALGVKRLHDFGKPGIIALVLFVPVATFIVFIALCIIPGDRGPNRYGTTTNAPG